MKSYLRHHTVSLFRHWQDKVKLQNAEELILVFTMGKVGSQSYYNAIKRNPKAAVFHLHTLDLIQIRNNMQQLKDKGLYPDSRNLAGEIKAFINTGKPVKIISAVRPPIERNLSAYFEASDFHLQNREDLHDLDKVIHNFQSELWHNYPISWFDREMKTFLGIDVYAYPFDSNLKYQRLSSDKIDVLILRTDLEDALKEAQMSDFLLFPVKLNRQFNKSSDKYYSKQYQKFISEISLDQTYVSEMLDNNYTKHFYASEEIEKMFLKWGGE